jgi:hypothetical protein
VVPGLGPLLPSRWRKFRRALRGLSGNRNPWRRYAADRGHSFATENGVTSRFPCVRCMGDGPGVQAGLSLGSLVLRPVSASPSPAMGVTGGRTSRAWACRRGAAPSGRRPTLMFKTMPCTVPGSATHGLSSMSVNLLVTRGTTQVLRRIDRRMGWRTRRPLGVRRAVSRRWSECRSSGRVQRGPAVGLAERRMWAPRSSRSPPSSRAVGAAPRALGRRCRDSPGEWRRGSWPASGGVSVCLRRRCRGDGVFDRCVRDSFLFQPHGGAEGLFDEVAV